MDWLIVRYGDLTLKGKNRGKFEKALYRRLRRSLERYPLVSVRNEFGRAYIQLNAQPMEEIIEELRRIPGLSSCSPALQCEPELEQMKGAALSAFRTGYKPGQTFKVSVRRVDKTFPQDTNELLPILAGHILKNSEQVKVDVRNPDFDLKVEIRSSQVFVYGEQIDLLGGFPYGSNGKAVLMLSGGIDSPAAGFLAIRQGLEVEAIHFHSYPYTSERAKQKVVDLARKLTDYTESITLHMIPFTKIQERIRSSCQEKLWITLMRRSMLRISEKAAIELGGLGIVTGESIGQVASQTLPSMNTIGRGTALPVLRPLITSDKLEIMEMAKRIGTYPISILPYEDCCTLFMPQNPSTNPNLHIVDKIEQSITDLPELLDEAWKEREVLHLHRQEKEEDFAEFL
ncbi:tRNA uracil 4-sulfurtransferase ThiI [Paenibacillus turpanensis]|uniref:tRNA uracil 4-sulfurtransferase ThiI n=1 Tax=Paenibacillus turpanensis TaxID=2689078 RepID=UPI00140B02AB|nr:tRNA uracil 4-sulfurtransferase ThiI [Paenibacillus turpanensis]